MKLIKGNCWCETDFKNRENNLNILIQSINQISLENNMSLLETIDHLLGFNAVHVLTGQEFKGKEFDYVFFAGLEEGVIPHYKAKSEDKISEERRIFYVAMTRTKKELFLSYTKVGSTKYGEAIRLYPSRFIDAIPNELITNLTA